MILKLHLSNFRNFKSKSFEFADTVSVIVGENASGKTNVLESLNLISTAKSFKANLDEEMINYDEEIARVQAKVDSNMLEVVLTKGKIGMDTGQIRFSPRKKVLVNKISKRQIDFTGIFKAVIFGPRDLELVTESPSIRRKFLDNVLSQVDREYRRNLLSYEKGLRQRNRLLYLIRENPGIETKSQLLFWNQLLIKSGDYISNLRRELIEYINLGSEKAKNAIFRLEYDPSPISESRLEQYRNEEILAATTLVGPHRDDFQFLKIEDKKERNLSSFGSRGEQRMGVLWIKMMELVFIEEKTGEKPTLLLDDIFSELDHTHRDLVLDISNNQQTIITTADPHFVENIQKSALIVNI